MDQSVNRQKHRCALPGDGCKDRAKGVVALSRLVLNAEAILRVLVCAQVPANRQLSNATGPNAQQLAHD